MKGTIQKQVTGHLAKWEIPIAVAPSNKHRPSSTGIKKSVDVIALIDTGALRSAIRSDFAETLGVRPFGKARVYTASQSDLICDVYKLNLVFGPIRGHLVTANDIEVLSMPPNVSCEFLLGMNVIGGGLLVCDGPNNTCTLTFDVPLPGL